MSLHDTSPLHETATRIERWAPGQNEKAQEDGALWSLGDSLAVLRYRESASRLSLSLKGTLQSDTEESYIPLGPVAHRGDTRLWLNPASEDRPTLYVTSPSSFASFSGHLSKYPSAKEGKNSEMVA